MALAVAGVGGVYTFKEAAAPGTNASDTCTSSSRTWATDDLLAVVMSIQYNSGSVWDLISITPSGGAFGTLDIQSGTNATFGGGYFGRVSVGIAKCTSGFTGTIDAKRTAGSADHWTVASFAIVTGQDLTTPRPQAIATAAVASGGSTTVTPSLGAAPASTSLLIGGLASGDTSATSTPPSGWTENAESSASFGDNEQATILTGGSTSASWVVTANSFGVTASFIEIQVASGSTIDVPLLVPPMQFNVHRM